MLLRLLFSKPFLPLLNINLLCGYIFQKEPGITDKKVNTVKPKAIENETVILKALEKDM
jgi:hypothetical protein